MSKIYNTVDLGKAEEAIRSYILTNFLTPKEMKLQSKLINFHKYPEAKKFLNDNLQGFYNIVGKQLSVNNAIIFGIKPNSAIKLHVDGYTLNRDNARNYALNIPIANCNLGVMHWYNGDYVLTEDKTEEALPYLKITWNSAPHILASAVIDQPTVVKVDIPHSVYNHSNEHRIILSLRFDPDIPE
jgi:hypothetical protein